LFSALLSALLTLPFGIVPASAANPTEQAISSLPSGALPISDYYNQRVYDPKDNKIGEVEDLLVGQAGKTAHDVVAVVVKS
jgi:hypothetical protein